MENRFDKPPAKLAHRKISRRSFLERVAKITLLGSAVVAVGAVALKEKERFLENEDKNSAMRLFGKPIEGETPKDFVTDKYGDKDLIIVRNNPTLSDGRILGYTDEGQKVVARAVWGAQYDSYDPELGGPIMKDGEGYGKWYEIRGDELVVYDEKQNKIDTHGKKLYMAGNFLKVDITR